MKLLFDESLSPKLVELLREVLRRNAIRIAELPNSDDRLLILDQ